MAIDYRNIMQFFQSLWLWRAISAQKELFNEFYDDNQKYFY
jgi:hypothetical protein